MRTTLTAEFQGDFFPEAFTKSKWIPKASSVRSQSLQSHHYGTNKQNKKQQNDACSSAKSCHDVIVQNPNRRILAATDQKTNIFKSDFLLPSIQQYEMLHKIST